MSTHTPGPWRLVTRSNQHGVAALAVAIDKPGCAPAWLPGKGFGLATTLTDQDEANARLIAAAPDLLAALREIETICTESQGDCRRRMGTRVGNSLVTARAAIAKAEGSK